MFDISMKGGFPLSFSFTITHNSITIRTLNQIIFCVCMRYIEDCNGNRVKTNSPSIRKNYFFLDLVWYKLLKKYGTNGYPISEL